MASTQPRGKLPSATGNLGPPGLLTCLILSWNDDRTAALQAAAEREAWEVIVSGNATEFLRHIFRYKVPLTLVDLPSSQQCEYERLRTAAAKASNLSDSLLVLCGFQEDPGEEMWARQLGAWSYLPKVNKPAELDWLFVEARKAVAQIASSDIQIPTVTSAESSVSGSDPPSGGQENGGVNRIQHRYNGGEMSSFPDSRRENHVHQEKKR